MITFTRITPIFLTSSICIKAKRSQQIFETYLDSCIGTRSIGILKFDSDKNIINTDSVKSAAAGLKYQYKHPRSL